MVGLVPAQERLRGWLCGDFPFGRRLYAGRGGVLSSRVPTTSGMALQCPGWLHSGGDDRTGPKVTGETCSIGLMSRCCPALARGRCLYPFRGFRRPLSRVRRAGRTGAGGTVDTGLTAQRRTVAEMAAQGRRSAEQRRDMIPRRCQRAGVAGIRP
jgi:hypothetical protein